MKFSIATFDAGLGGDGQQSIEYVSMLLVL